MKTILSAFKCSCLCLRAIILLSGSVLFSPSPADAQKAVGTSDSIFNKYRNNLAGNASNYYVTTLTATYPADLPGTKIIRTIGSNIAIIRADNQSNLPKIKSLERLAPANNTWKLSPTLEAKEGGLRNQKNTTFSFSVIANDIEILLASFRQKKMTFRVTYLFKDAQSAVIQCNAATLFDWCLPEPDLLFADLYYPAVTDVLVNGYNRSISNVNLTSYLLPAANGNGITIGIKERNMDEADIDLQKRVLPSELASAGKDFHATTVSTLAGGAGNSFYSGKGVAWKCNFFPSSFDNLFPDSSNTLRQKNVTVQNHSYGTQIQPFYGAEALSYDVQTQQNNSLVHVFSSGNRGTDASTSGTYANLAGFSNLTGNFKMAKNIITVAAADTGGYLASFSSAGPLYDGRLGPQITSLGPNGTSEAAAIVSGAIAVLQQVYKDSNAQAMPPASLVKAVLYNSADDIGSKGIDYHSGYGLLNIYSALNCLQQRKYEGHELQQSGTWLKNIVIPAKAANLKVTLSWTDTAALVNNNKALVNDLDLEVRELKSGLVYKPWCLSVFANVDSLLKLPERKRDSLNTSEQVSIDLPAAGQYEIRVAARQVLTFNKQQFHIAYNWDTLNTLRFRNPVCADDINTSKNTNLKIQWKTALVDTNTTGILYVTYDSGRQWQVIDPAVKLYRQSYNWLVPEKATSAQLRIECSFGNFNSIQFVIAPLTSLNIDYLCPNALGMSWQKNAIASAYQVYALGDTAFLKPISVTKDTFIVLNRTQYPENTYAVQPILQNGLFAARSLAINIQNQGVNCLYRTLQAETAGDSISLTLDLSTLNMVDSIVFERVNPAGTVIKPLISARIIPGQLSYRSFDGSPAPGINYFRAKIWSRGSFVYTETVFVTHNGKTSILLYPNPVVKGQKLNILVKETEAAGTLQVADFTGRIMGIYEVTSGSIKTQPWASGIYLYRLISAKGTVTATGKFIIQ